MVIVVKAKITYGCKCGNSADILYDRRPIYTSLVGAYLGKSVMCGQCRKPMRPSRMVCNTIEDVYGDPMFGYWHCPIHNADIYYPNLIKSAQEQVQSCFNYSGSETSEYFQIAKGKFPWQCPKCGLHMKYGKESVFNVKMFD